jgi:hypothetical protein
LKQLPADVGGKKFGRRIGHWQEPAIAGRENPPAILERGSHLTTIVFDPDLWVSGRQHDVVIEIRGDRTEFIAKEKKVDDIVVRVEWAGDLDGYMIVVAVQPFALAIKCNEVGSRKNMFGLGNADVI